MTRDHFYPLTTSPEDAELRLQPQDFVPTGTSGARVMDSQAAQVAG